MLKSLCVVRASMVLLATAAIVFTGCGNESDMTPSLGVGNDDALQTQDGPEPSVAATGGADSSQDVTTDSPEPMKEPRKLYFPDSKVCFTVPADYVDETEADGTLAITPAKDCGITLRFTLHSLPEPVAEEFLQSKSDKNGNQVVEVGGKMAIVESGARSEASQFYDMSFLQIGFGDSLVVMSAEIEREKSKDEVVVSCLGAISEIVRSMKKEVE